MAAVKGTKRAAETSPNNKNPVERTLTKKIRHHSQVLADKNTASPNVRMPVSSQAAAPTGTGRAKATPPPQPQQPEALTFDAFKMYMDSTFARDMKEVKEDIKKNRKELGDKVDNITEKLASQENDVADLQRSVMRLEEKERDAARLWKEREERMKKDLGREIRTQLQTSVAQGSTVGAPAEDDSLSTHERHFYWSRRSIKLWPVRGETIEQLWVNTGDFLHDVLEIAENEMDQTKIEQIQRSTDQPPRADSRIKDEIVVTFLTAAARDLVLRSSSRLSKMRDADGNPTAGVRIHIPNKLRGIFNLLERYGHFMRQKHGKGTKTHIKFDESDLSLFTNIKLPGESEWARITPAFARKTMRDRDASMSESLGSRYGVGGEDRLLTRRTQSESQVMDVDQEGASTSRRPAWSNAAASGGRRTQV